MSKPPGDNRSVGCAHPEHSGGPGPPYSSDPIAAQIEAEITDHLATSAEQLQSQGLASDLARQKSQEKFGDPAAIGRNCYWIKQGDALMFRTTVILLLSVVSIALGIAVFTSWRTQHQMADQMTALAEQLKALAERERSVTSAPAAPAEPKPLEITGQVFFGTPDKPAASTEVMICRASDGEVVRRVTTGDDGTFQSGPLTAGDYTLVAKGVKASPVHDMGIQTEPLYLYPGMPNRDAHIDATYRAGRIAVQLSRPLPSLEIAGKYKLDSRLYLAASTTQMQSGRWTTAQPIPARWPIYITLPDRQPPVPSRGSSARSAVLSNTELGVDSGPVKLSGLEDLAGGPCSLVAAVFADVLPADFAVVSHRPLALGPGKLVVDWMSHDYVLQQPMGAVWMAKLRNMSQPDNSMPRGFRGEGGGGNDLFRQTQFVHHATIEERATTRLRIEIPHDIESRIQRLIETVTDSNEFLRTVQEDNPFIRQAKITVLGTEPLKNDEPAKPALGETPQ